MDHALTAVAKVGNLSNVLLGRPKGKPFRFSAGPLGFRVRSNSSNRHQILEVVEHSQAYRLKLRDGDHITGISGQKTDSIDHSGMLHLLRHTPRPLVIHIWRPETRPAIRLVKDIQESKVGVHFEGSSLAGEVKVKCLDSGGTAQRFGVLVGDTLVGVNDKPLAEVLENPTDVEELAALIEKWDPNFPIALNINQLSSVPTRGQCSTSASSGSAVNSQAPLRSQTKSSSPGIDQVMCENSLATCVVCRSIVYLSIRSFVLPSVRSFVLPFIRFPFCS